MSELKINPSNTFNYITINSQEVVKETFKSNFGNKKTEEEPVEEVKVEEPKEETQE